MKAQFRSLDTNNLEQEIAKVHDLVAIDLTEPYTIPIYLYFLKNWPRLAIFAYVNDDPDQVIGVIVGSLRAHQQRLARGYIAMLAVQKAWRGQGIAKQLIHRQIKVFEESGADDITLEAETSNKAAVHLYESQGFLRTRRMHHYYFVMQDAYRLVLPLSERALKPSIFLPPLSQEKSSALEEAI